MGLWHVYMGIVGAGTAAEEIEPLGLHYYADDNRPHCYADDNRPHYKV